MGSSRGRWTMAGIELQESVRSAREAFLSGRQDGPIGSGFIPGPYPPPWRDPACTQAARSGSELRPP